MNKPILEVVHENAEDLYAAGLMDEVTLRKFDALCLPPITEYDAGTVIYHLTAIGFDLQAFVL